jgi:uncharacterized membrane protein
MNRYFELVFYFFIYSAVGWLIESIYCSVAAKKWINRGFLKGPICPIYGTGAIVMMVFIAPYSNYTDKWYLNTLIIFGNTASLPVIMPTRGYFNLTSNV